jgi:hypothetical protein
VRNTELFSVLDRVLGASCSVSGNKRHHHITGLSNLSVPSVVGFDVISSMLALREVRSKLEHREASFSSGFCCPGVYTSATTRDHHIAELKSSNKQDHTHLVLSTA